MEDLPPPNLDPIGIPDAVLVRPYTGLSFDTVKIDHGRNAGVPKKSVDAKSALARAIERLASVVESLMGHWTSDDRE